MVKLFMPHISVTGVLQAFILTSVENSALLTKFRSIIICSMPHSCK